MLVTPYTFLLCTSQPTYIIQVCSLRGRGEKKKQITARFPLSVLIIYTDHGEQIDTDTDQDVF